MKTLLPLVLIALLTMVPASAWTDESGGDAGQPPSRWGKIWQGIKQDWRDIGKGAKQSGAEVGGKFKKEAQETPDNFRKGWQEAKDAFQKDETTPNDTRSDP